MHNDLYFSLFLLIVIAIGMLRIYDIDFITFNIELLSFSSKYLKAISNGERPPKFHKIGWFVALVRKLQAREIELLNKYCPYYAGLNEELKKKFERRLIRFKYEKDFYYTRESEKNKELMVMLLSAFAVQVSFGFEKFCFNHFRQIYIHKQSFSLDGYFWLRLSGFTAGSRGYIAFSETAFLKSIEYPEDGFNVAIHEFAHALDLCGKIGEEYLNRLFLHRWQNHAMEVWRNLKTTEVEFLSEYAQKDIDEFYACTVERFFEQPGKMQELMPETFYLLVDLLQQNPLNKQEPVILK